MKANRKFLNENDEGVSPVIAVILMVAITVVLAATVYVWVSGFGASGKQAPNLSVSKVSGTSEQSIWQINSISANNIPWTDLEFRVDGVAEAQGTSILAPGSPCAGALSGTNVAAGVQFCYRDTPLANPTGKSLSITHTPTGTVLTTVTM